MERHAHQFRCQPRHGRCPYPDENLHLRACEHFVPLPPDVDVFDPASDEDGDYEDGLGGYDISGTIEVRHRFRGEDYDSDQGSSEESDYSHHGYVEEIHSHREPGLRGNSRDDEPLDRIFRRMSDMRLGGDESSRSFGRNAFMDNESFFSDDAYADGFLLRSADRTRSLHRPGRTSGRNGAATRGGTFAGCESRIHDAAPRAVATPVVNRGATATRGGRQANTRSPPPTAHRRGATSPEGRSAGTRPYPSTGLGGANLRGGSRGGHRRATHSARPRSPVAHDESRENRPNPSTGRGGMGLPGQGGMGLPGYGDMALTSQGGMALLGRGSMISHGRYRGGNRHATHTTGPQAPTAQDESQENRPNPSHGRGGIALPGRGGPISHGRSRGGNHPQADPPAAVRGGNHGGARIPTTASTSPNAITRPTKLPTPSNSGAGRGGPVRGAGSSNAAGVVASEQGGSHQRAHPTNSAEQPLEVQNTEDDVQALPGDVTQPAAHYVSKGPIRADDISRTGEGVSSTGEGTSGTDAIASRSERGANAPLEVSEEESDSVLVHTPPHSPQGGRNFVSVFESDSEDEYEIVEEAGSGGTS